MKDAEPSVEINHEIPKNESAIIDADVLNYKNNDNPISNVFERFLTRIEDIREAALIAGPAIGTWQMSELEKCKKSLAKYSDGSSDDGKMTAIAKGAHASSDLLKISKKYDRLRESKAVLVLMRSLFVGIFSEYDVFIGDLIQAIHEKKPELFKNIKREISLSELLDFSSVEAVKKDILEKEIDSFRRNSYVDQFVELENKFGIKTLRSFSEWPTFVELGQRRNLLTHNGGICSDQYISVCEKAGVKWEKKPNSGEQLYPDGKYFGDAIRVVTKVAFMLTHTLWRKILPNEVEVADKSMNDTIFDILSKERWIHASEFAEFSLSEPMIKNTSDMDKRIRVINSAISLIQTKKPAEAIKVLNSLDWTASVRDFQLAICVLKNEFSLAAELMKKIGKEGEVIYQLAYHNWPLFQEFRDRREFHDAYEIVYGIPFIEEAKKEAQAKVIDLASDSSVGLSEPLKKIKIASPKIKTSAIKEIEVGSKAVRLRKTVSAKVATRGKSKV